MSIASIRRNLKQTVREKDSSDFVSFYSYAEAFLYFADMAKDTVDTFSPYKRSAQRYRDLFQLIYGIQNLLLGVIYVIPAIMLPVADLMYITFPALFTNPSSFFPKLGHDFYALGGNLLGIFSQSLRGATQIITSPLSLLRISWRNFLSMNTSEQKFQERKSIQRLISEADVILENNAQGSIGQIRIVLNELARKAESNLYKQQASVGHITIPTAYTVNPMFSPVDISTSTFIDNSVNDNEKISKTTIKDYRFFSHYLAAFRLPENQLKVVLLKYKSASRQTAPDVHLALRCAARQGNLEDVTLLLDIGKADPSLTSTNGNTALMWARDAGHQEVVKLLGSRNNLDSSSPSVVNNNP